MLLFLFIELCVKEFTVFSFLLKTNGQRTLWKDGFSGGSDPFSPPVSKRVDGRWWERDHGPLS